MPPAAVTLPAFSTHSAPTTSSRTSGSPPKTASIVPRSTSRSSRPIRSGEIAETLLEGVPKKEQQFGMSPTCGPEGAVRGQLMQELLEEVWKGDVRVGGILMEQLQMAQKEDDREYDADDEDEDGMEVLYEDGSEEGEIREVATVRGDVKNVQKAFREMKAELDAGMEMDVDSEQELDDMILEEEENQLRYELLELEERQRELEKICAETVEEVNLKMADKTSVVAGKKVGTAMYSGDLEADEKGGFKILGAAARKQQRFDAANDAGFA